MNAKKVKAIQEMAKEIIADYDVLSIDESNYLTSHATSKEEQNLYVAIENHLIAVKQQEVMKNEKY